MDWSGFEGGDFPDNDDDDLGEDDLVGEDNVEEVIPQTLRDISAIFDEPVDALEDSADPQYIDP